MSRRRAPRWLALLAPVLLLATACGVPISAEEITATAESVRMSQQLSTIGEAAVSSRGSEAAPDSRFSGTPSPVATLAALGTPAATASPGASVTPIATASPAATAQTAATGTASPEATPGTPEPSGTPTPQPTPGIPTSGFGAEVVNLVNKYRAEKGLAPLRADPYITTAANNYARLIATERANVMGLLHDGPDGSSPEQRLAASGYAGSFCGENLAAGQTNPQGALDVWKSSAGHNAILLASNPTDIGVGYFYNPNSVYKHYWVLMTARPIAGCPPS